VSEGERGFDLHPRQQAANSRQRRTPRSPPVFGSRPRRYAAATVSAVSGRLGKASWGHRKDARGISIIGLSMAALPRCAKEDVEAGSAALRVDWPVYPRRAEHNTVAEGGNRRWAETARQNAFQSHWPWPTRRPPGRGGGPLRRTWPDAKHAGALGRRRGQTGRIQCRSRSGCLLASASPACPGRCAASHRSGCSRAPAKQAANGPEPPLARSAAIPIIIAVRMISATAIVAQRALTRTSLPGAGLMSRRNSGVLQLHPATARAASIPAATAKRDWPKKTEDWQVETAAAARSLLSGDNTFIEQAMWLCRREAEVAL
jgi:hypothetical protein